MRIEIENCRTSRLPDEQDNHFGWTIHRVGIDRPSRMVILSNDIFGIRTHYFRGRTGPCLREGCDACNHKQLSRWKGYLLAKDRDSKQQIVFEFTPPGAAVLDHARLEAGTLRGLILVASRAAKKPNAKVILTMAGVAVVGPNECPDYSIWPILARIWGLAGADRDDVRHGGKENMSEFDRAG